MYTYRLGGMLITDELYHDDLEAVTFGRKDQNELMHYGIKGQSWGKRRFQNEDGSLTAAGRNRYDVGAPLQGVSAFADTGSRRGSGANYNRLPGGTGGSTRSATANQAPERLVGSNPRGRATTSATTTQKVANTTNAGRKAADSLFGRIGNWASNAAKDVGNFATNTYNDASKAVGNAANAAGSWVGNAVKDVGNLLSNEDEKKAAENAQKRSNQALNNAINRSGEYVPDGRGGEDLYIRDANDAKMVDIAEQQAANAQQRYDDHPVTQVQNAAKSAGNWIGNTFNDAKNWVGNAGRDVGNFATNVYNDTSKAVGNAANDVGNFVNDNYNRAREAVNGVAGDVGNAATSAFNDAKNWAGNAAQDVGKAATNAYNDVSKAAGDAANWVGDRAQDVGNFATNTANDVKSLFSDGSKEREALAEARSKVDKYADDPEFMSYFYEHDPEGAKRYAEEQAEARKQLEQAENNYMDFSNNPVNTVSRALNLPNNKGNWAFAVPGNEQYLQTMKTGFIPKTENIGDWFTGNNYKRTADTHNQYAKDYEDLADQAYAYRRESAETGRGPSQDWWNSEGDYIKNVYAKEDRDIADANMNMYNNAPRQKIVNAANQIGETVSGAAKDVGNWAGNAAKDVTNWGGQQVENGKKLFKKIFG